MSKTSRDNKKKAMAAEAKLAATGTKKPEAAAAPVDSKRICQACSFYRRGEPCSKTKKHVARKLPACGGFKAKGGSK